MVFGTPDNHRSEEVTFQYPYKRVVYEGSLAEFVAGEAAETVAMAAKMQGRTETDGQHMPVLPACAAQVDADMERRLRILYGTGAAERVVAYGG